MTEKLYLNYLNKALSYYNSDDVFIKYFGNVPKSRDITFKNCLDHINNKNTEKKVILELGTSRSFTDGRFPGCNNNDVKYWEPNNHEKWDWSAGCYTRFFSELTDSKTSIHTVDISPYHINRCKTMTEKFKDKISYYVTSSENILNKLPEKSIDLLYLDTGDMTPIEFTAQLHLREAKIIVERNILKDEGIILIDDVKSCVPKEAGEKSDYGKAKYSIPYFLENGYEIIMGEYQFILKKNPNLINIYSFIESLKSNDSINIIECGGHMGKDTKKILEILPKCNLYCIEANKKLYNEYLLPLKHKYNNLHIFNIGLSDTNEEKTFYIDTDPRGDAGASSFLPANPLSALKHLVNIEKPITIKCVKLDDFINNNKIDIVNFLWLDVEQYEYTILNSCNTLSKIKYIYTEVNYRDFRLKGHRFKDIYNLLTNNNFVMLNAWSQGNKKNDWQANVLFKNKNY